MRVSRPLRRRLRRDGEDDADDVEDGNARGPTVGCATAQVHPPVLTAAEQRPLRAPVRRGRKPFLEQGDHLILRTVQATVRADRRRPRLGLGEPRSDDDESGRRDVRRGGPSRRRRTASAARAAYERPRRESDILATGRARAPPVLGFQFPQRGVAGKSKQPYHDHHAAKPRPIPEAEAVAQRAIGEEVVDEVADLSDVRGSDGRR